MPRRPPVALALVVLAASCAGGKAAPIQGVRIAPVNGLPASTLIACRGLKEVLPDPLPQALDRRAAAPASDTTTAYGDPAISVRCGVEQGSERDDPYVFNKVRWAMHDSGATRTWTTLGRKVNVEVVIPDAYSSQAELVGALSFAVTKAKL